MSDDNQKNDDQSNKGETLPLMIHGQYVQDVSFENPHAPSSLKAGLPAPKMNVRFGVSSGKVDGTDIENLHEVKLTITAEAKREEDIVFIAEVQYSALVSIEAEVSDEIRQALLLIEVPRMTFPFARQIVTDLTIQGGYPPLFLNPVDFRKLYENRTGKKPPTL